MSYIRKTDRPYLKLPAANVAAVEAWYVAKLHLGNQKQMAGRLGISEARVQQICEAYRKRQGMVVP